MGSGVYGGKKRGEKGVKSKSLAKMGGSILEVLVGKKLDLGGVCAEIEKRNNGRGGWGRRKTYYCVSGEGNSS